MNSWLFWDNQPVGEDLQPQLFGTYGSVLFGCLSVNSAPTAEVLDVAMSRWKQSGAEQSVGGSPN